MACVNNSTNEAATNIIECQAFKSRHEERLYFFDVNLVQIKVNDKVRVVVNHIQQVWNHFLVVIRGYLDVFKMLKGSHDDVKFRFFEVHAA